MNLLNNKHDPSQLRQLFERHCVEESPWGNAIPEVADRHFAVMSAVRSYLPRGTFEEVERRNLKQLVELLRTESCNERDSVKKYVGRALEIVERALEIPTD